MLSSGRRMESVFIVGTGYHHPEDRITNADLEQTLPTTGAWILEHTGIAERRRVDEGVLTSHLAATATQRALTEARWDGSKIELMVCATSSPDAMLPSTAAHIANKLGIDPIAFDVNAACAGFAYGLAAAGSFMETLGYQKAALCCSETYTRLTDPSDRKTAILFGDGAATLLLQRERPAWGAEVVDLVRENWHEGLNLVSVPVGGTWEMDGQGVKGPALGMMVKAAETILERNEIGIGDLRAFMAHQANLRILDALTERLGVSDEQHWCNIRMKGNQGGAGVLATFCEGVEKERDSLQDGDLILLTVVGSGFTSGAVLLRWIRRG